MDFLTQVHIMSGCIGGQKINLKSMKIDPKGHRNQDASWAGIWTLLGKFVGGFFRQVVGQVGPKLASKSGKDRSRENVKQIFKKV